MGGRRGDSRKDLMLIGWAFFSQTPESKFTSIFISSSLSLYAPTRYVGIDLLISYIPGASLLVMLFGAVAISLITLIATIAVFICTSIIMSREPSQSHESRKRGERLATRALVHFSSVALAGEAGQWRPAPRAP